MSRAARFWICAILLGGAAACQRETPADREQGSSSDGSGETLDRMQLGSARRVALESATDAMQRGDLERLRQLSVWVRKRAQVVILEADDLEALELSIGCLERGSSAASALERLSELTSGTLRKPAQKLCSSKQ